MRDTRASESSARANRVTAVPTRHRRLGTRIAIGLYAWSVVFVGCDPQTIAPLPSPHEPDETKVLLSSLQAADGDATENRLVAVVGIAGAVGEDGTVEISNPRTGRTETAVATATGGFAGKVYGQADDILELVFVAEDGRRSDATIVNVATYTRDNKNETPLPAQPTDQRQPAPPGIAERYNGGGFDCDAAADPGCEDDPSAPEEEPVAWVLSYADGVVTLQGPVDFAEPDSIVVVSNLDTGAVSTGLVEESGAVRIDIAAEDGHTLIVFAQNAENAALTSPAEQFTVAIGAR